MWNPFKSQENPEDFYSDYFQLNEIIHLFKISHQFMYLQKWVFMKDFLHPTEMQTSLQRDKAVHQLYTTEDTTEEIKPSGSRKAEHNSLS